VKRAKRLARWVLSAAVFALSLHLALREVDLLETVVLLQASRLLPILLGVLAVLLGNAMKAWRWKILLGEQGEGHHIKQLFRPLMIGQALNWFYPARAGDFVRAYEAGRLGPGGTYMFATIALEKLVDMAAFGVLFLLAAVFLPLPDWISNPGVSMMSAALGLITGLVVITRFAERILPAVDGWLQRLPARLYRPIGPRLAAAASSLGILKSWRAVTAVVLWTTLIWVVAAGTNYVLYFALDLPLTYFSALVMLLILQVGITVPSVPGRVGVFQYLCILGLALFGVTQETALSYGLLLHAVVLLPTFSLGMLFWLQLGEQSRRVVRTARSADTTELDARQQR
jgi:glycosyltransferase 2 family protein